MLEIQTTHSQRFDNLDSLRDYAQDEHDNTRYVPIDTGLLQVNDDKHIYNGHDFCQFNEHGLKSLFTAMGVNGLFPCMMATEEPRVATDYLNKLLNQDEIKETLSRKQLIIKDNQVIGVVSLQYNRYSNHRFLEDFISKHDDANSVNFERGMVKNTKMYINWLEQEYTGIEIDGKLDRSKMGFYSGNSMVGDAPVTLDLTLFDTMCTNGMKISLMLNSMRAVHKGSGSMRWRLGEMLKVTRNQYNKVKERLETILAIPYEDHTAERLLSNNAPLSIIPELKEKRLWHTKKKFESPEESVKDLRRSIGVVQNVPMQYGGSHTHNIWNSHYRNSKRSMYHYVGAFTEYAQTQSPDVQYQIEEEAGNLTSWIHKNKEVLLN